MLHTSTATSKKVVELLPKLLDCSIIKFRGGAYASLNSTVFSHRKGGRNVPSPPYELTKEEI